MTCEDSLLAFLVDFAPSSLGDFRFQVLEPSITLGEVIKVALFLYLVSSLALSSLATLLHLITFK